MEHPSEEILVRFFAGETPPEASRRVVRHLLSRCPACSEALSRLKQRPAPAADAYDAAFDRLTAKLPQLAAFASPELLRWRHSPSLLSSF